MQKKYLEAALFLITECIVFPAFALDLMQSYELALINDPAFRSATMEYEAGIANLTIGRSGLMPQLTANYYGATNKSTITQPPYIGAPNFTSNQNYQSNNSGFQLIQSVFSLQAYANYLQGSAQADSAKSKFIYNSQDLLIRVLQAYTDLLNAQDQLNLYIVQKDAYLEQLKVNESRFKRGEGTKTDILETQASFSMSEAQVLEAHNLIQINKRKLEDIIGVQLPPTQEIKPLLSNFKVLELKQPDFDFWQESALIKNAEIITSKHNEEVARQEYRKNIGSNLPIVSAIANWNQQNSFYISTINQNASTSTIGVQATWSIFNGGQTIGQMKQSYALYEKSKADLELVRNRVLTELRKQFDIVFSSTQKINALQRAVNSATELTKAMRKSTISGERINMDALIADKGLATAQRDLSQAKYNYILSLLRLKQLAGTLSVEDLEEVAHFFQRNLTRTPVAKRADSQDLNALQPLTLPELSIR